MKLKLVRYDSGADWTMGLLLDVTDQHRTFLCYTLEDEFRLVKVPGETRIPHGYYFLDLRTDSPMSDRYAARYPEIHRGMIWLRDVPGFEWVYLHVGNDDDDTDGCILVGDTAQRGFIGQSVAAYRRVYPPIASAIAEGQRVALEVVDYA